MTNRDRSTTVARLFLLLAVATQALPSVAAGQSASDVPLFLAIPESFPDVDGRVVLLREPGRDIVLLRGSDATPETLSVALHLLRRLNASTPRREGQGQMVPVTGYVLRRPLEDGERERLDAALTRLSQRPTARVGNLGPGRSMPFPDRDG
jgi:hypothetical protein